MIYYIGCEFAPVPNWRDILPPILAPSNYKDQGKIAAYIATKEAELEQGKAATQALTGSISRVLVIGSDEKQSPETLHDFNVSGTPGPPGSKALEFILEHSGALVKPSRLQEVVISGVDIRRAVRLMALDYISANGSLPLALHWALGMDPKFRYNRIPGFIDPVSILFGSSAEDTEAAGRRFGLPVIAGNAESLALFAFHMTKRLSL
jgi:hypothetical protein